MEIRIIRTFKGRDYTVGDLFIDGAWQCNTLEPHAIDWTREKKTLGKTAIPEGRYELKLAMSRRYGCLMPYLLDVPHFTGIMIHKGMTVKDTKGCILVGHHKLKATLLRTRQTFDVIMEHIVAARRRNEKVTVSVS